MMRGSQRFIQRFARGVSILGSFPGFLLLILLLYPLSPLLSFSCLLMLVFVMGVVYLIKWLFPTKRPDHGSRKARYFWQKVDLSSFPSAHAARAAGLLVVMVFARDALLSFFSFVFLLLVSWSRVVLKRHYWRDILGGVVIGVLLGVIVMARLSFFLFLFSKFF